jgi:hypothetical protein
VVLAGIFAEQAIIGDITLTSTTPYDATFIAGIDPAGQVQWANQYEPGQGWVPRPDAVKIDSAGNRVALLEVRGTFNFGAALTAAPQTCRLLLTLDASGDALRNKPLGLGKPTGGCPTGFALAMAPDDRPIVTGAYVDGFGPGTVWGVSSRFVAIFNEETGAREGAALYAGNSTRLVETGGDGSVYVAHTDTQIEAGFGPLSLPDSRGLVLKLSPALVPQWVHVEEASVQSITVDASRRTIVAFHDLDAGTGYLKRFVEQ